MSQISPATRLSGPSLGCSFAMVNLIEGLWLAWLQSSCCPCRDVHGEPPSWEGPRRALSRTGRGGQGPRLDSGETAPDTGPRGGWAADVRSGLQWSCDLPSRDRVWGPRRVRPPRTCASRPARSAGGTWPYRPGAQGASPPSGSGIPRRSCRATTARWPGFLGAEGPDSRLRCGGFFFRLAPVRVLLS